MSIGFRPDADGVLPACMTARHEHRVPARRRRGPARVHDGSTPVRRVRSGGRSPVRMRGGSTARTGITAPRRSAHPHARRFDACAVNRSAGSGSPRRARRTTWVRDGPRACARLLTGISPSTARAKPRGLTAARFGPGRWLLDTSHEGVEAAQSGSGLGDGRWIRAGEVSPRCWSRPGRRRSGSADPDAPTRVRVDRAHRRRQAWNRRGSANGRVWEPMRIRERRP